MKKIKSLKLFVFIKCLLLLGLMLTCKNEEDINLRTVAENAFLHIAEQHLLLVKLHWD